MPHASLPPHRLIPGLAAVALVLASCAGTGPTARDGPQDPEGQALAGYPARPDLDSYRSLVGPAPIEPPPAGYSVRRIAERWWIVAPSGRLYWASALRRVGCGLEPHAPVTPYRNALLAKWGPGRMTVACPERALARMYGWGFSALGTGSSETLYRPRRLPFLTPGLDVARLAVPSAAPGIPDAFLGDLVVRLSPGFPAIGGWQDAPFCLGHLAALRPDWDGLAAGVLALPDGAPARADWLAELRRGYGTIGKLNAAWKTSATSFETLRWPGNGRANESALRDMRTYRGRFALWLWSALVKCIRIGDPVHMVFGGPVVPGETPPEVVAGIAKACDVVLVSVPNATTALPAVEQMASSLGKPVYLSAGIPDSAGPAELPLAWRRIMERLAALPGIVGAEVADYMPNADGTAFVGWDDIPEITLTEAARKTNERLLRIHSGELTPLP